MKKRVQLAIDGYDSHGTSVHRVSHLVQAALGVTPASGPFFPEPQDAVRMLTLMCEGDVLMLLRLRVILEDFLNWVSESPDRLTDDPWARELHVELASEFIVAYTPPTSS